jgi:hypothetical protein
LLAGLIQHFPYVQNLFRRLSISWLTFVRHFIILQIVMTHRDQLTEVRQKILELEREQQRVGEQLAAYKQMRDALEVLSKTNTAAPLVSSKIGPTEAIRVILGKHPDGLVPTQIRDELKSYGISCGSEKNLMSNIHAIIKRDKDIEQVGTGGWKVYRVKKQERS